LGDIHRNGSLTQDDHGAVNEKLLGIEEWLSLYHKGLSSYQQV
jgi:hypothetical protein